MESCIQSVRPELYAGYMQLKQQFIDNKIGILDTTPDMEMTIAISDAYLGEGSSSVPSLGRVERPVRESNNTRWADVFLSTWDARIKSAAASRVISSLLI